MPLDPQAAQNATSAIPGIPRDADGPVFREPWEAQAFAMAVALHARGLFTWPNGRRRWPMKSSAPRRPAMPIPARPITGTGWRRWNG
jgi:hypothetical protein